jgi:signal transduction histidine kinase
VDVLEAVRLVTTGVFAALAVAAVTVHRRQRTEASRWLIVTFGVLGAALLIGRVLPEDPDTPVEGVLAYLPALLLIVFPYALLRFAGTFRRPATWLRRAGDLGLVLILLTLPFGIDPGATADDRTAGQLAYVMVVLAYWTVLSGSVVVRLLLASRGQPTVARRRLRVLALGAGLLNLALFATLAPDQPLALQVGVQLLAITCGVLFLLGFAPPAIVRREWRVDDEQELRAAERDLLSADDTESVAAALLPPLARLFGGEAALLDLDGRLLGSSGAVPGPAREAPPRPPSGVVEEIPDALVLGLERGLLLVRATPFTPFFGSEEIGLLRSAGASLDLALSRVHLQELERRARDLVEETNAELEALLYGISHDLRAPLVALTGYVELLTEGVSSEEERRFVLERVTANTSYMDALIRDLLELSRVGRIDERSEPVDLRALAEELADELRLQHPQASFEVGELPIVTMSGVRARQLLGNLMTNAVRHGGRDDITVRVIARAADDDGMLVSVADDGVGIAPEHRIRVFGIFERLQARDERTGGTGIGLAMCRKIVEQLGGTMWVGDTPTGTDIRFLVPARLVQSRTPRSLELSP